ncbi:MAG TPA: CPBP family intramembrane glutamic endopeptidase [Tahibacter sp.]|uniref:CPBP family intramembrane glutamic endopeptidase n=1 Tax=Tahibacter sp. TaxID=2056211 RepID=UPI002B8AB09B|nr:CPBP family intramembrane glutamic endopeptidase [Tahibacter sp.]HSX59901.1 CPBP family intramembrane glutamic endopeptidase [Tahibacter sp.]
MIDLRPARRLLVRLVLAGLFLVAAVQAYRLALLPALLALFEPGEAATGVIRRFGILVFALASYFAYVRLVEKRAAREWYPAPRAMLTAAAAGAALISITTLSLFALDAYQLSEYRGLRGELVRVASVILIAATLEELVYRGILFRLVEDAWGTTPALWLQAAVFGVGHLENVIEQATPLDIAATVLSCMLLGAFWALVYVWTRNLWVASLNHAAWNFAIVLSGAPLSGLEEWRAVAPIASTVQGPAWLTGGIFGPEASAITLVVLTACLVLLWRRTRERRRRAAQD